VRRVFRCVMEPRMEWAFRKTSPGKTSPGTGAVPAQVRR
jgi:hypothetical protein